MVTNTLFIWTTRSVSSHRRAERKGRNADAISALRTVLIEAQIAALNSAAELIDGGNVTLFPKVAVSA